MGFGIEFGMECSIALAGADRDNVPMNAHDARPDSISAASFANFIWAPAATVPSFPCRAYFAAQANKRLTTRCQNYHEQQRSVAAPFPRYGRRKPQWVHTELVNRIASKVTLRFKQCQRGTQRIMARPCAAGASEIIDVYKSLLARLPSRSVLLAPTSGVHR